MEKKGVNFLVSAAMLDEFRELCHAEKHSIAADLREYIRRRVSDAKYAKKRRQKRIKKSDDLNQIFHITAKPGGGFEVGLLDTLATEVAKRLAADKSSVG